MRVQSQNLPSSQQLQRTTGYQVDADQLQKARSGGANAKVQVQVPGQTGLVELPLDALDSLFTAYKNLRGPEGLSQATPQGETKTLTSLRADLNRRLFDGSPLTVTNAEARSAHKSLIAAAPAQFSNILEQLDDKMLNRYFSNIADAEPFDISSKGPSALGEFATKVALEMTPEVGRAFVGRLDDEGKRRFLEGVLQMPTGALVTKLRGTLGEDGFAALVKGSKADSLIGGGLIDGRVFKDNVTGDFKTQYAAALDDKLPLPPGAEDTVFMTGPGLFGDQLPGYLEPNSRALAEWGVPKENIHKFDYNTADHPTQNADKIYEQIKANHVPGKRLVVMGHSKFGRDMLEAFAKYPDLKEMVDGSLLMQPAISAQIAKDLLTPGPMEKLVNPMLQLVGGNRGAFNGMADQFEDLPKWPGDEVPTMVMASSTESPSALLHALNHPYYKAVYNAASDGAVSFQNQASIDGASLVTLPALADHAQPGLSFKDAVEHFAQQIDAGAPDDVITGMLQRLSAMVPQKGAVDMIIKVWEKAHDTPEERARCSKMLRAAGPMLDRMARVVNRNKGYPIVENEPMTKALMNQLFERMP